MRFAPILALAGAVAVVATAAFGGGAASGVPRGFSPQPAAAVGAHDLWVLGDYRCDGSWCLALLRSRDAGEHFTRVGLPPLPAQGDIASLTFTSARIGFVFVPGGRLYRTDDGGISWRRFGPVGVTKLAVGGGDVYALISRENRVERSRMSRSSWHTLSLPVRFRFVVSIAALGPKVWLLGSKRDVRAGDVALRSVDRGNTFARSRGPCVPELAGELVPAGRGVVWAVCPTGMMAGLSLSTNGGRTFPAVRSFHDPGGVRLPGLTNGADVFPISPRAAILYPGAQGPLLRTGDRGGRWMHARHTARVEEILWLGFGTNDVGAAIVTTRSRPHGVLMGTADGGATWHSMPIH